jgi:hypothetical protein
MDQTLNSRQADNRKRSRLGFLGTGWIGRSRLESLAQSGLVDIIAVADPCAQNCEQT